MKKPTPKTGTGPTHDPRVDEQLTEPGTTPGEDDSEGDNDAPAVEDLGGLSEAEHEYYYGRHERGSSRGCFGTEPFATWNRAWSGYSGPD